MDPKKKRDRFLVITAELVPGAGLRRRSSYSLSVAKLLFYLPAILALEQFTLEGACAGSSYAFEISSVEAQEEPHAIEVPDWV